MHIDQDILFTWGAVAKIYGKGECVFSQKMSVAIVITRYWKEK
jgi:hypothetical protein